MSSASSSSSRSVGIAAVRPLNRNKAESALPPNLKSTDTYTSVSSLAGDHIQYVVTHDDGSKTTILGQNYSQNGSTTFRTIKTTPAGEIPPQPKCNLFGFAYNEREGKNPGVSADKSTAEKTAPKFRIVRN